MTLQEETFSAHWPTTKTISN